MLSAALRAPAGPLAFCLGNVWFAALFPPPLPPLSLRRPAGRHFFKAWAFEIKEKVVRQKDRLQLAVYHGVVEAEACEPKCVLLAEVKSDVRSYSVKH